MPPPIAPAKKDAEWGRLKTEATVRAWFAFMAVSMSEMLGIRREWEARFAQLPTGDSGTDTSEIPPELHLKWPTLKSRRTTPTDGGPPTMDLHRPDAVQGVTGALENPPVNPLTGLGRTPAQVKKELRAYQNWVRSTRQPFPALFQADYILALAPGHTLRLHRVASGLFIENATAEEICFQTVEYTQELQGAAGGFWGVFHLTYNENYNASNPKLGPMYLRHNQMTREHVSVYNVEVIVLPARPTRPGERPVTRIRIHANSLAELARRCPEFPVPSPLPATHIRDSIAVAPAARAAAGDDSDDEEPEVETHEPEEEEDPPPPIPAGFSPVLDQTADTPLLHFMMWTALGRGRASWHVGKVVKTYGPNFVYRGKAVTHDVQLDGKTDIRPVNLSSKSFDEKCWLAIEPTPAPTTERAAAAAPATAAAAAPAAAPRPRRGDTPRVYECE